MQKIALVCLALVLASCKVYVSPEAMAISKEYCSTRGGLGALAADTEADGKTPGEDFYSKVHCNDGSTNSLRNAHIWVTRGEDET